MKKIVIVSGSSRVGNTEGISREYEREFKEHGCDVELITLSTLKIAYCDGCLKCDETQKCEIKDDFDKIIDSITTSDLVVFGTPTRWRLMSGELKTFLDRLNPLAVIDGYRDRNVFIFAVGQNSEDEGSSILEAISSVSSFSNDAGMNILLTRPFYELYGSDDYLGQIERIRQKCKDDVAHLMNVI